MASLSLRHIYKVYQGGVRAVSDFNLEIEDKEFVVFVGPSGCGKSTTLRMVAGLEEISAGELYIDGKLVNDVEPKDRDIAMVFQNYALYPHMTVYDNMAFGLKLRKMHVKEIDARVQEAAAILGITPLLSRKPKALSGGQRQRVALGRAIVREPKVFLLDEPLSNLDAKLRVQMRTEITKLHNKLATTFIYVTHDQTEAMTMGTRIVVMKDGIVQQVDTPQCLYDNPENKFVASFLGSPQMNFFDAMLIKESDKVFVKFGENKIELPESRVRRINNIESYLSQPVIFGARPEDIHDEEIFIASSPNSIINAKVDVIEKLGNETILYLNVDGKEDYTIARIDARSKADAGDELKLAIDTKHIHLFDPQTELSIMGVPKVNSILSSFIAEKDNLTVRFGNVKIDFTPNMIDRLITLKDVNNDVMLEINPSSLYDKKGYDELIAEGSAVASDFYSFNGTVDFTEKYPKFIAVYSVVDGKNGYMVSKQSLDSKVTGGDKITLYGKIEEIQLRDLDSSNKLLASRPVTYNQVSANVTVKENITSVAFGKSKLVLTDCAEFNNSGTENINILPASFAFNKEALLQNPKTTIVGKIIDAEVLGSNTICYVDVMGVEPYLTAIVPDSVNLNVGDKMKLTVYPNGVKKGDVASKMGQIAQLSKDAKAYTFTAPKKEATVKVASEEKAEPAKKAPAKKTTTTKK